MQAELIHYKMINEIEFILYVADQNSSKLFYEQLLQKEPCLHVPGMTEFQLSMGVKLGLMPEMGIAKIITDKMPHPAIGSGIPRCEIYVKVNEPQVYIKRALTLGAQLVDELKDRDWGDKAGYVSDLDGHIIAFAAKGCN